MLQKHTLSRPTDPLSMRSLALLLIIVVPTSAANVQTMRDELADNERGQQAGQGNEDDEQNSHDAYSGWPGALRGLSVASRQAGLAMADAYAFPTPESSRRWRFAKCRLSP